MERSLAASALASLALALAVAGLAPAAPALSAPLKGDPVRGKQVYGRRCSGCHTLVRNGEGPRHLHVYGARAGSVPDYDYSEALAGSNIVWDEVTLDRWLADPEALIPGQGMGYQVRSARDRADIIAYLKSFYRPGRR
ncbi:MAG: c-type cytochrome [Caulobacteraceae bacterium]|nr:c-type cytochrome [Caulobacteraceae bacterium]